MNRLASFRLSILLGLIGGLLGWWTYGVTWRVGMSVKWRDLPTELLRPQKPIGILGGDFDAEGLPYVYVETDDGNTYSCQRPAPLLMLNTCWVQTDSPRIGTIDKGCEADPKDVARHRRFVISDPPGMTTDRIRLEICGDFSGVYEYALLEDGTIWVWSFAPKRPWRMIYAVIFLGMGGCPGVLIGLVLSYLGRRWLKRRKGNAQQRPTTRQID